MLDVRQLFIRPSTKPGYLKGTFTLYCAYMRGDVGKAEGRKAEDGGQRAESNRQPAIGNVQKGVAEPALEVPAPAAIPPPETGAGVTNSVAEKVES